MVVKLIKNGIFLKRIPIPGFGRLIPYDEIEGIQYKENGHRSRLVIQCVGERDLMLKNMSAKFARELLTQIEEILNPSVSEQKEALRFDEIAEIARNLYGQPGIRPSIVLKFLTEQAIFHRATDIHFEYIGSRYQVRFRIDSILHNIAEISDKMRPRLIAYIKNEAGLASYRKDVPQEGRYVYQPVDQEPMVIRLSIIPALGEESLVLRLFDALRGSLDLDNLGYSTDVRMEYAKILEKPQGLILLSGPSNSGKTTTIYSSIQYLMNGLRAGERAVSLEDPIEFPVECASQMEVNPTRGITFDLLLSSVLRQDVEIIVVGEIRDVKTAGIALRAALTGHLIISTVHCGRAAEVPRRLIDLGLKPGDVSEALVGVVAQRLVRVVCSHCKIEEKIATEMRDLLNIPDWLRSNYKGEGCELCMGTGYLGQTVIAEYLTITNDIREMLRQNAPIYQIQQEAQRLKMPDIRGDAFSKVAKGLTSLDEIRRVLR